MVEDEDVDERPDRGRERNGEDDREAAEEDAHHRDRDEGDERRQPHRVSHDMGVDDVALELADADEHEQGERGDMEGLRQADRDDEDRADELVR